MLTRFYNMIGNYTAPILNITSHQRQPHTPIMEHLGPLVEYINGKFITYQKSTHLKIKLHRKLIPQIYDYNSQTLNHHFPLTPSHYTWTIAHTLTIPNYQPYLEYQLHQNTTVKNKYVPI